MTADDAVPVAVVAYCALWRVSVYCDSSLWDHVAAGKNKAIHSGASTPRPSGASGSRRCKRS